MSAQARLSLEGTTQPIVARVLRSEGGSLVVGRKLPFLRLGAKVLDAEGRAGSIRGVSLRIDDGVPHLALELEYDEVRTPPPPAVVAQARVRRDPTLGYEARSSRPPATPVAPAKDDTNHDSTLGLGEAFRPSLAPMPLPIPEAPPPAPRRPKAGLVGWLAMLAALLLPWLRPVPLLGVR